MSKVFEIRWPEDVPASEFNVPFAQGMADRMAASWFKYGTHDSNAEAAIDFLDSLKTRLARYEADGNTEWLIDVANLAMIEFLHPSHPDAHFRATDSAESPGRSQRFTPKFGDAVTRRGLHDHVTEIENFA